MTKKGRTGSYSFATFAASMWPEKRVGGRTHQLINLFEKLYTPKGLAVVLVLGVAVNISLFWFTHRLGDRGPTQETGGGQRTALNPPAGLPEGKPEAPLTKAEAGGKGLREETDGPRRRAPANASQPAPAMEVTTPSTTLYAAAPTASVLSTTAPAEPVPSAGAAQYASPDVSRRGAALAQAGTIKTTPTPGPGALPPSGGPALALPAAALLLGSGILTYAVLRRR
jgi:hypothetical protein